MPQPIDLENLVYKQANFAHSERERTSMAVHIQGSRPFYYMWLKDGGMDIVTFTNPNNLKTAKLFRYTQTQLYAGVHLMNDKPLAVGHAVVALLKKEYIQLLN